MEGVREFFNALYPADVPDGMRLLIWMINGGAKSSFWPTNVENAAMCVSRLPETADVYCGVGLSPQDFGANARCKADQIAAIPALWLDIDIAGDGHKKKSYPADQAAALELINAAGVKPTIIVHSGHGLQAWWCFNELWNFEGDTGVRQYAAGVAKGWTELFRKHAAARGWTIDSTFDLARVMRVPGTNNCKAEPVPVRLLTVNDVRYEPEHLAGICGEIERAAPPEPVDGGASSVLLRATAELPAKFAMLCANEPLFALSWQHARADMSDTSDSSYDLSLASMAVRAGWSDQEIADLIIVHRRLHNGLDKALRTGSINGQPGYVAATIERAKKGTRSTLRLEPVEMDRDAKKKSPPLDPPRTLSDNEDIRSIQQLTGLAIVRILRSDAEPSVYTFFTSDGAFSLSGKEITSQEKFRHFAFDALRRLPLRLKPNAFDALINLVGRAAENDPVGEEAKQRGETLSWLGDYLDSRASYLTPDIEVQHRRSPWRDNGTIFLSASDMKEFLYSRGNRVDLHPLIIRLSQIGGKTAGRQRAGNRTIAVHRFEIAELSRFDILPKTVTGVAPETELGRNTEVEQENGVK